MAAAGIVAAVGKAPGEHQAHRYDSVQTIKELKKGTSLLPLSLEEQQSLIRHTIATSKCIDL